MASKLSRILIGISALLILIFDQVNGQERESNKALKSFEKAYDYFNIGQWADCESELRKAVKADSTMADAYILLGDLYLETGKPGEAVDQYLRALELNPEGEEIVINLLANTLFSLERYSEASIYYEKLLNYPGIDPELKSTINFKLQNTIVRKNLVENPVSFNPVSLGKAINTDADEYINSLSADGKGIFFTRRMKNPEEKWKEFIEDFYFAEIDSGYARDPVLLNYPPGKDNDAGAICISPDGRLIFFTACFRTDSYGSCDLYFSEKKGDSWSYARNMGAHINSDLWDAQPSISSDGKTLYFVSNREGSIGSSDIWKTERTKDGGWSMPENLGSMVNTVASEMAPFIHYDNQTLYYSSQGLPGLGGADLYKVTLKNGTWTEPVNLGYPINSSADELALVINTEGNRGFISSNSLEGQGGFDIFMFDLYKEARPVPVSYLKGKVFDLVSGFPLEARFELTDIDSGSSVINAMSDPKTGGFLVCLPCNRNYALNVSCDGYLFYSEHFPLSEIKSRFDPVLKDIPLEPVAPGKTMVLRNIFYETDQYQLKPSSGSELDRLLSFLKLNKDVKIEVGGHTDNEGTEDYNRQLSMKRAESVAEYLSSRGISPERISYKGYGESKPVSSNETEEGRAQNRRTEIKIL
jgi:tetratricopeptide (TPR) repeat protein